jgi:hypothetical protein
MLIPLIISLINVSELTGNMDFRLCIRVKRTDILGHNQ